MARRQPTWTFKTPDASMIVQDARDKQTVGKKWRHVKRGTVYREIARGTMQVDGPLDMAAVVIYEGVVSGDVWVRPTEEFLDGRFEPVDGEG